MPRLVLCHHRRKMIAELKNVVPELFDTGRTGVRLGVKTVDHPPRILMLYGSVRERSYSRLATEEAARLLTAMGADVRIFNPSGLLCRMMQRIRIQGYGTSRNGALV